MDKTFRVLVTGGAGFIGSHLCERLLGLGHEVICLDNFDPFYDPEIKRSNIREIMASAGLSKFHCVEGDVRDGSAVYEVMKNYGVNAVVHLAALAGVRPSIEKPALYANVNIIGTQNILDACVGNSVKHLVFASSSSVYGNNVKVPFQETDPVDFPVSPYAATKKAGELLCHTYSYLHGLNLACLRFFTVYGPRQRPDLAIHKFARLLLKDDEIPFFGDGTTSRDYTYIDDIVDGIIRSLSWNIKAPRGSYEIFNLGESCTIPLSRMVEALEDALGRKARLKHLPLQPGDVDRTYADISKASLILGYCPMTEFESGIQRFAAWLSREPAVAA